MDLAFLNREKSNSIRMQRIVRRDFYSFVLSSLGSGLSKLQAGRVVRLCVPPEGSLQQASCQFLPHSLLLPESWAVACHALSHSKTAVLSSGEGSRLGSREPRYVCSRGKCRERPWEKTLSRIPPLASVPGPVGQVQEYLAHKKQPPALGPP